MRLESFKPTAAGTYIDEDQTKTIRNGIRKITSTDRDCVPAV